MQTQTNKNYFLSQPHQPFFLLGIVNAILVILLFALNYKGVISLEIESKTFHVYTLVYLVFTNLFTGFLFTTFPRFNQTEVIKQSYYIKIFYLNTAGSLLFLLGSFISQTLLSAAMILLLFSQLLIVGKLHQIYKKGVSPDKRDSFWILTASYIGLIAHLLFMGVPYFPAVEKIAISSAFYLYLIFLAFSVGQRMIPFFSHSFAQKNEKFVATIFILFIAKVVFYSSAFVYGEIAIDILLAIYLAKEFLRWELHPLQSPPILWVLHLALLWLPVAFLLSAITLSAALILESSFYFLATHLLAIGFLTTLLIGFGTRVTLGHSGQPPLGDRVATKIFLFVQLVVVARTLFSINIAFGWGANFLFDISFALWLLLFLWWGGRYAKVLLFGSKL